MKHSIRNLASGTMIYGAGQALNRLVSLLLLPLFTAYLTPQDYGIISLLALVTFVTSQLFGLGFGVSLGIVYFKDDNLIYRQNTIWTAFYALLVSSIFALILFVFFSDILSVLLFQNSAYKHFLFLTALSSLFNGILSQPFIMSLQFKNMALKYTILNLSTAFFTALLNIIFVILLNRGVEGWIYSNLIGSVITFLVFILFSGNKPASFKVDIALQTLKLGIPMIPSFLFILVMQHSGRYMLQLEHGLTEVGIFNIGYNFGMISTLAVNAFTTAWYPYFNSFVNRREEAKVIFPRIMTYYVIVFGMLGVLFFIFARPIVYTFTHLPFHESHKVVGLINLANVFSGLFSLTLPGIYFAHEVKLVNLVQIVCCCSVLLLNYLLIPGMGITGVALAMTTGFAMMPVLQLLLNRIRGYISIKYQWKRIFCYSTIYAVAMLLAYFCYFDVLFYNVIFLLSLFSVVLLCCWLLFNNNEKQQLKLFAKTKSFSICLEGKASV